MAQFSFEWDEQKSRDNELRHGIPFEQARQAFYDPRRVTAHDAAHSRQEPRFFCIGKVGQGVMTVRYTIRGERIRIIGAGYWRKGRRIYEKENQIFG